MRTILTVLFLLGVTSAHADDTLAKCALKAGELLPRVPGLVVTGSSEGTSYPRKTASNGTTLLVVIMDFTAAGQSHRQSYMCGVAPSGNALIVSEVKG